MDHPRFDALTRRIFTVTSRRSTFAVLAGMIALWTEWLVGRSAGAQRRRPNLCRPLGQACFPDRGIGCCGNAACRQGQCRCRKNQRACRGRCISKRRCCRNRDCAGGQRCRRGRCRCSGTQRRCGKRCVSANACCPPLARCDGACVNLKSTRQHCGACGNACAGTAVCRQGACVAGGTYREVRQWSEEGMGSPLSIAVDRANNLYVADTEPGGDIWKFTGSGQLLTSWPAGDQRSFAIDVSPANVVYVAKFDQSIQTYSSDGTPRSSFVIGVAPQGLAVSPSGEIYVTDGGVNGGVVQRLTATGDLIDSWSGPPHNFSVPFWVAVAPNEDVYVTEASTQSVTWLSATGGVKGQWNAAGPGNDLPVLPIGITVDPAGFVYVVIFLSDGSGRVQKFTASGGFVGSISSPAFMFPTDVAVSRTGMVYVAEPIGGVIVHFEPA